MAAHGVPVTLVDKSEILSQHALQPPPLLNLTPHALTVFLVDKTEIVFPHAPGDPVARCTPKPQAIIDHRDFPIGMLCTPQEFMAIEGLPADLTTDIIVSRVVAEYMRDSSGLAVWKGHVFSPDTGPKHVVRDAGGKILGTTYLEMWR